MHPLGYEGLPRSPSAPSLRPKNFKSSPSRLANTLLARGPDLIQRNAELQGDRQQMLRSPSAPNIRRRRGGGVILPPVTGVGGAGAAGAGASLDVEMGDTDALTDEGPPGAQMPLPSRGAGGAALRVGAGVDDGSGSTDASRVTIPRSPSSPAIIEVTTMTTLPERSAQPRSTVHLLSSQKLHQLKSRTLTITLPLHASFCSHRLLHRLLCSAVQAAFGTRVGRASGACVGGGRQAAPQPAARLTTATVQLGDECCGGAAFGAA